MPQISEREFEMLPLRVHALLADVPLHDVWAVDLPRPRAGITLDEFRRRVASARLFTPSPIVRALLGVRLFLGRFFGWDRTPSERNSPTFADRLTPGDRARSHPRGYAKGPAGPSASSTGSRTNSSTK
jgi:hypothetical protein